MIRIIKGVYGYLDENGMVKPKTEKDAPFELTREQEERLVGLGVAVYVEGETSEGIPTDEPTQGVEEEELAHLDPDQLEELTNAKLKELAEDMGLETSKLRTKAQLIEAITAADVIPGPAEDDGEELPSFDAAEAVE